MTAFLVTATIIQTRHLMRHILHRRREPRHCSGEMFTTRQVFNGLLDLFTSVFAFGSEIRRQANGQSDRRMFRHRRRVFVHKFLKSLLYCFKSVESRNRKYFDVFASAASPLLYFIKLTTVEVLLGNGVHNWRGQKLC